jgi:rare lipoprotein A
MGVTAVLRGLLFLWSSVTGVVLIGCAPAAARPPDDPVGYRPAPTPALEPPSAPSPEIANPEPPPFQTGDASWYGNALAGRKTASGELFDPRAFTAAHNTLKLGTWVEVRRPDTGRAVRVRINDRGPHAHGRIIDLSRRAAQDLDLVQLGVARVEIRVVDGP